MTVYTFPALSVAGRRDHRSPHSFPTRRSSDLSGGIIGWITRKAGEAWDWVKEQTRPVWQPVADAATKIAELIPPPRSEEHTSELQTLRHLVCRLLLEKKKTRNPGHTSTQYDRD